MTIDANKSFDIGQNGLMISGSTGDIIWVGGGPGVPTHVAPIGSRYFRTDVSTNYNQAGPGTTNNWVPTAAAVSGEQQAFFFGQGKVGNKFLAQGAAAKGSDNVPYVVIDNVDIDAISWSNHSNAFNVTIEVYKNGLLPGNLIYSLVVLNKRTIAKTNITPISLLNGDRISVYIKKNDISSADDPVVTLYLKVTSATSEEVST